MEASPIGKRGRKRPWLISNVSPKSMLVRAFSAFALLFAGAHAAETPLLDVSLSLRRSTAGDYVFVVRNSGAKPVFYSGYGGSETAPPIFSVEILQDGQWKSAPLGWCGTGLGQSFIQWKGTDWNHPAAAAL